MGENITITAIKVIIQEHRTLLQIDLWFEEQNKGGRVFIEAKDLFKLLAKR